jgi:predicted nucleic acid-binding protein
LIVADTNLIAYLLLRGEHTAASESVLIKESHWIAPLLWQSEFRNVLAVHIRRNDISVTDAEEVAHLAETLLRGNEYRVASGVVLRLAASSACSAYDCEFVALAQLEGVPLVTTDKKLLEGFPAVAQSPAEFVGGGSG